eukprot:519061-Prorocentrum_minimum.AAC.2
MHITPSPPPKRIPDRVNLLCSCGRIIGRCPPKWRPMSRLWEFVTGECVYVIRVAAPFNDPFRCWRYVEIGSFRLSEGSMRVSFCRFAMFMSEDDKIEKMVLAPPGKKWRNSFVEVAMPRIHLGCLKI